MTTVAAQRLKMGSTEYFLASLTAGELVTRVRTAEEVLHDWDNLSIEDRIQRNINLVFCLARQYSVCSSRFRRQK